MITKQEIADKLKQNGKYWIAFTGDSIASCEWVHPNWREIVQDVLENSLTDYLGNWKIPEWGIKGFNFGFDGATTKNILEKVDVVKSVSPDLVIGLMGGNDPTFNVSVSESVENIKKIVETLNTKVVWCNSTCAAFGSKKNKEYEPYAKAFMDMIELSNLQKIDMFTIYKQFSLERLFTFKSADIPEEGIKAGDPDLQHPNQLGNAYIAKVILKESFGIEFNPEIYWSDVLKGEQFPKY